MGNAHPSPSPPPPQSPSKGAGHDNDDDDCFVGSATVRSALRLFRGADGGGMFLKQQPAAAPPSKPQPPPPPKVLVWGCGTPEEHYECVRGKVARIERRRERVPDANGEKEEEGDDDDGNNDGGGDDDGQRTLRELGFEFRMVHHPDRCMCDFFDVNDDFGATTLDDDDEGFGAGTHGGDENRFGHHHQVEEEESYMVPIGVPLRDCDDGGEVRPEGENERLGLAEGGSSMAAAAAPDAELSKDSRTSELHVSWREEEDTATTNDTITRSVSSVSLFSLGTHYSRSGSSVPLNNEEEEVDEGCSLRLYHVPSETLVTAANHETFIARGAMYDGVAALCMDYAQRIMMEQGDLVWVPVSDDESDDGVCALVSRDLIDEQTATTTTATMTTRATKRRRRRRVLLVVTGKGEVRAGIFSRRHLMTHGVESATAIPMIREAVTRDMDIVMLDPNAKGWKAGMEVVEKSLERLFFERDRDEEEGEEIYVLAHSMAGAQLVRLLRKFSMNGNSIGGSSTCSSDENTEAAKSKQSFQRKIAAIAFTDSNHNINWVKDNPSLTNLLVGPSCLYIKAHRHHDDPKHVGEPHDECEFWSHRFGAVRTLWAGTHEHALTNYTARYHIWHHFDCLMEERSDEDGLNSNEEDGGDEELIPGF